MARRRAEESPQVDAHGLRGCARHAGTKLVTTTMPKTTLLRSIYTEAGSQGAEAPTCMSHPNKQHYNCLCKHELREARQLQNIRQQMQVKARRLPKQMHSMSSEWASKLICAPYDNSLLTLSVAKLQDDMKPPH